MSFALLVRYQGWKTLWLGFIAVLLFFPQNVYSNWLYLAISGAEPPPLTSRIGVNSAKIARPLIIDPGSMCNRLHGLNQHQINVCYSHPGAMPSVSFGARSAIVECQYQFKYERWNCTTVRTDNDTFYDLFGATIRGANRESAFISAITSAGVVHSVTTACSAGNLTYCGCDNNVRLEHFAKPPERNNYGLPIMKKDPNVKYHVAGCSDNVKFGSRFAKIFLDRAEKEKFLSTKDTVHLMNQHNHEVGREAIISHMKRHCRCHGVSGSCEFKTCWISMPKFSEVGSVIKDWYNRFPVQVARRSKKRLRRKEKSERKIPIRPNELVYVNKSPNYCQSDKKYGVLGTQGRQCNRTSLGSDSCDLLCCGRGYDTRVVEKEERCLCKFVWCCYVKCKRCKSVVDVHTCK